MAEIIKFAAKAHATPPEVECCCQCGEEADIHVEYINMDGEGSQSVKHFCAVHAPSFTQRSEIVTTTGNLGFVDVEAAFNMRAWLKKALEAHGAAVTGGGFGMGQADLDIELEGFQYGVSIRPLQRG